MIPRPWATALTCFFLIASLSVVSAAARTATDGLAPALQRAVATGDAATLRAAISQLATASPGQAAAVACEVLRNAETLLPASPAAAAASMLAAVESLRDFRDAASFATVTAAATAAAERLVATEPAAAARLAAAIQALSLPGAESLTATPSAEPASALTSPPTILDTAVRSGSS